MSDYQTLLFDLDGTLTDPKPGITRSVQYALQRLGIEAPDLDALVPFIGPPLAESFHHFYNLSATAIPQAIQYYREYFAESGLYENIVYPGITDLLKMLQTRGKRLVVATSKPTIFAQDILHHFGLYNYFNFVAGSELNGDRSEKAEVIAFALAQLPDCLSQTALMIGDRKHDIIGARKNGLASVAVGYGYGTPEELAEATPTYLVKTMAELTTLLCDASPATSPFRQLLNRESHSFCDR